MKKVLVGAPISDMHRYCFNEFLNAIKNLSYKDYDVLLLDNSKEMDFFNEIKDKVNVVKTKYLKRARDRVVRDHNILRKKVLKEGYDYLLILDQDVIPPKDIIERLLRHNKEVIAGLYFGHHILDDRSNRVMPFAWVFKERKGFWGKVRYLNDDEVWKPGLVKIAFAGGGCILISRKVLEKIRFRYSKNFSVWDDRWLGYDVYKNGFEMWLDNTVKCKHLYLERPFSWNEIRAKKED